MNRTAIWKQPEKVNLKPLVYIALSVIAFLILWRVRHLIYPMSVTTFIRVVAYGVIPLVLAWAGDHFAADVVVEPRKKRMYRAFFIFFAVLGIALIAIVENRVDTEHAAELRAQKKDTDEQRNNLKAVLEQMPNIMATLRELRQRPGVTTIVRERPPAPPPTEEAKLHQMSNAEFRQYALDWAKKLRDFETKYSIAEEARFSQIPFFGQDQEARARYMAIYQNEYVRLNQEHLKEWKNDYWGETVAIYNEALYRYKKSGKAVPTTPQFFEGRTMPVFVNQPLIQTVLSGELVGPHPIDLVADDVEILVRNLPN